RWWKGGEGLTGSDKDGLGQLGPAGPTDHAACQQVAWLECIRVRRVNANQAANRNTLQVKPGNKPVLGEPESEERVRVQGHPGVSFAVGTRLQTSDQTDNLLPDLRQGLIRRGLVQIMDMPELD